MALKRQTNKRWDRLDSYFIFKLTNGDINCSELLATLNFQEVSCRKTKQLNTFYVLFERLNYGLNVPLNRLMQLTNNFYVDLFVNTSIDSINIYLNNLIN